MKKIFCLVLTLFSLQVWGDEHKHHGHHDESKEVKVSEESVYNVTTPWTDSNGQKKLLSSIKGKVQVVAMVYTSCQYACPLITADIKKIESLIPEKFKNHVGYALFSFDPSRDTAKVMSAYAEKKSLEKNNWNLFTSSENGVRELAAVLGIKYKKDKKGDFDHSNIVFILDREGVVVHQQVGLNQDPKESIEVIKKLLK